VEQRGGGGKKIERGETNEEVGKIMEKDE